MLRSDTAGLTQLRARGARGYSSAALILANLVPLAGVLFFGWRAFDVVFTYWLESCVIGVFTVFKLRRLPKASRGRTMTAGFFTLHYGMFTLSLFFAIVGIFSAGSRSVTARDLASAFHYIFHQGALDFGTALLSFTASHYYSYRNNFIAGKEYQDAKRCKNIPAIPYIRLVLTLLVIWFGVDGVRKWDLTLQAGAVFLIVLRTAVDLAVHRWEHRSK